MLESLLKALPDSPGVYEMKNEENVSLYIGKAKSLKNRVKSYFQHGANHSARIAKMIEKVTHIEWTTVSSEWEALVLESNLIKEKNPKFNVLLRDDKNFSYIRVSVQDDFPMITISRKIANDGALYFGPKTSSSSARKIIALLQQVLKIRTTPLELFANADGSVSVKNAGNIKYPCLNFHLKKCDAPCIANISQADYKARIDKAIAFLKGDTLELEHFLETKMKTQAAEGLFEKAAKTRDYLFALRDISKKQLVSAPTSFSADVVGVHAEFSHVFFHVFSIRMGKLINSETFSIALHQKQTAQADITEAIERFFQDYQLYSTHIPEHILVSDCVGDTLLWNSYFLQVFSVRTKMEIPKRGDKKKLLDLATHNAKEYARRHAVSFLKHEEDKDEILQTLQKKLHMKTLPKRIECYDISHFSGEKTYASMVVFENGLPKNKDYRIFSIQSLKRREINDFASLEEALFRRLSRISRPFPEHFLWAKITRKKDLQDLYPKNKIPENSLQFWACFDRSVTPSELIKSTVFTIEKHDDGIHFFIPDAFDMIFFDFLPLVFQKYKKMTLFLHGIHDFEKFSFEKLEHQVWRRDKQFSSDASFSSIPDLIVIDGGKGQLSVTSAVLQRFSYLSHITICSLAKEQEEVFVPCVSDPIAIHRLSPEGKLLQRIRDEAHRFAITKNRTEREKSAKKSLLDDIKGLGPKTKKQLKAAFQTVSAIASASDQELLKYVSSAVLKELRKKI